MKYVEEAATDCSYGMFFNIILPVCERIYSSQTVNTLVVVFLYNFM